jgi:hypothetical protein
LDVTLPTPAPPASSQRGVADRVSHVLGDLLRDLNVLLNSARRDARLLGGVLAKRNRFALPLAAGVLIPMVAALGRLGVLE